MSHTLLRKDISFAEESYISFKKRYDGFGKDLYDLVRTRHPDVFLAFVFYRSLNDSQPLDSYAVYSNGSKSFAIQLNYIGEIIGLWNYEVAFEIGTWAENEYDLAIKAIEENFLCK